MPNHRGWYSSREKAAAIRKVLVGFFGRDRVSCHKGRGTASHWVSVRVCLPPMLNPYLARSISEGGDPTEYDSDERHAAFMARNEHVKWIDAIAHKAVSDIGARFATFCSDGPENVTFPCLSVAVEYGDTVRRYR